MLENGFVTVLFHLSCFASPDFVDCFVHLLHDVESVEYVYRLPCFLSNHSQVRFPHVTANELPFAAALFAQHSEEAQKGLHGSVFPYP